MTFHRITDPIPEFDTEDADGAMTDPAQDGAVTEAGAAGADGVVILYGGPWRRISTAVSSFTRL